MQINISIHTPARGVTFNMTEAEFLNSDFNPHSRKGSDVKVKVLGKKNQNFNPHSRKGSDSDQK